VSPLVVPVTLACRDVYRKVWETKPSHQFSLSLAASRLFVRSPAQVFDSPNNRSQQRENALPPHRRSGDVRARRPGEGDLREDVQLARRIAERLSLGQGTVGGRGLLLVFPSLTETALHAARASSVRLLRELFFRLAPTAPHRPYKPAPFLAFFFVPRRKVCLAFRSERAHK